MMAKYTAAVIVIGDEILRGQIVDTNSSYIASSLYAAGFKLLKVIVVPDNVEEIASEVLAASKRYNTVITCGGVGPTHDDVTYQAIAKAFNLKLEVDSRLLNLYSKDEFTPDTSELHRLATVPTNSDIIQVKQQLSQRMFAVIKVKNVHVLPGSPKYCRPAIIEIMSNLFNDTAPFSTAVDFALNELSIIQILDKLAEHWKGLVSIGSYPKSGTEVRTSITFEGSRENVLKCKMDLLSLTSPSAVIPKNNFTTNDAQDVFRSVLSQPHVRNAYNLIEQCFITYKPSEIFISFNGGKDCTVVLHLAATILHMREAGPLLCVYLTGDSFPEVDAFVEQAINYYGLHLVKKELPTKNALYSLTTERSHLKACLMGMRRNDPGSEKLEPMTITDPDWPQLMRINPILEWTYKQVWDFILTHNVPYCSLYDEGYTSLGNKSKTIRNPILQDPKNPNKFLPAHNLVDDSTERQGRIKDGQIGHTL